MKAPKKLKTTEFLTGREALVDTIRRGTLNGRLGKTEQRQSLLTNPRSKHYNPTIAKNRAKEKNRRAFNAKMRG